MAECRECRKKEGQRDGLCPSCRLRGLGLAARKYRFAEELQEEIRAAWRLGKYGRARAIDKMMAQTGWPRHAFKCEAIRLGLPTWHKRRWTAEEEEYVREKAGVIGSSRIAKNLGRSKASVESHMAELKVSRERKTGYNAMDLQRAFGRNGATIKWWMDRGLFGQIHKTNERRVTEANVMRFIRRFPHEYDLRRVDQTWYKAMLFGDLAGY